MKVRAAGKTDVGLKRKVNEDSLLIDSNLGLYLIADGVGGHKAGEVASRMVVDTMAEYFSKLKRHTPPPFFESTKSTQQDLPEIARHLVNSITFTNQIVHEAQKKPKYRGMASTVSAVLLEKDCIWCANVGDSPVYVLEQGALIRVSEEHSIEAERKGRGFDTTISFANPMFKHILTRVIGLNEKVDAFITSVRPKADDLVLMCSDGLTNYMPEKSIETVLMDFSFSLERKVDILVEEAIKGGGGDNISVVLLEVLQTGKWRKLVTKIKSPLPDQKTSN